MKAIAAILAVLVLFPAASFAAQNDAENVSRVYRVSGDVFVTHGKNPAQRVTNSEPVVSDTLIETGDKSAALLKFEDGQVVTMQADSIFKVREYRYDAQRIGNSSIVFSMFRGGMRFITGLIGQHDRQAFRLSTPDATIGIRGTDFMVSMVGKSVYSRVLAGKITMTNAAGMKTVGIGQTVVATSSAVLASPVSTLAVPAGTFNKLQFIPIDPSAITIPVPVPEPPPASAVPVAAAALPETPEAAPAVVPATVMPAASAGIAGTSMTGMAAGEPEPATAETAPPVATAPAASPEESPESAKAADANPMDRNSRSDIAVVGKIGSLGLGAELDLGLTGSLGARIGLNSFNYKYNANSGTVNYDFKLQLQTVSALVDWYPFQGSFRTSLGVMYNNNKVSLDGQPTGGTYTINGNTYPTTAISSLQGDMTFNKVAPYIGIGWGNPAAKDKGWGMTSDIGVLFQGSPKTSLTVTCTGVGPCPTATDIAAENAKLQSDLSNFKWWPVVSVGISYQW